MYSSSSLALGRSKLICAFVGRKFLVSSNSDYGMLEMKMSRSKYKVAIYMCGSVYGFSTIILFVCTTMSIIFAERHGVPKINADILGL